MDPARAFSGRGAEDRLRFGAERALESPPAVLAEGRVGLLLNQASLLEGFEPTHEAFARRFQLRALFSPQHGFFGEKQDNMIESGPEREPRTGLPVHSLYGETRRPTEAMLDGLDVLAVDLQDVGCRVYTFVWTLSHCLEECARRGIEVVVLERPNPLGLAMREGAPLEEGFETFVGRGPLPMRHGGTLGSLARWWDRRQGLGMGARLHVIDCEGPADQGWAAGGRPWIPPSPNLPRLEGAQVYCGQVLWEGTNLSEGRGTTTPFELCGAPFIQPEAWIDRLQHDAEAEGVVLRPVRFEPTFGKWKGQRCGGVQMHVLDAERFRPLRTSLRLMAAAWQLWPGDCQWSDPPYEYETEKRPIDCIAGGSSLRHWVESGEPEDEAGLKLLCDPGERLE